jgi:RNA polymerase sigma-B factor
VDGFAPAEAGCVDFDAAAVAYHERLRELGLRARRRSREQLVELALPFAERVAGRFGGRGEPLEDIQQVARLALIRTVDQYDPARGSFTAYAAATIRGEIKRHFRDHTWGVHVPRRLRDLRTGVARTTAELTAELARSPTSAEIAQRLGASETDVLETVESVAGYRPASLNAAVGEGTTVLGDLIGQRDGAIESLPDRLCLAQLLGHVPERERRLLALRFHGNMTQTEIAEEIGLSQVQVSRLLASTLSWLRHAMLADVPSAWPAGGGDCPQLGIAVERHAARTVARVSGDVDRDHAEQIRQALVHAASIPGTARLTVDLASVPLVDAAGLAALETAADAAARAGVELRLATGQPLVRRAVALSRLGPCLDC